MLNRENPQKRNKSDEEGKPPRIYVTDEGKGTEGDDVSVIVIPRPLVIETRFFQIDREATAQSFRRHREQHGYSHEDLRVLVGNASKQSVYKWESASGTMPSIDCMIVLMEEYQVDFRDLIVYHEVTSVKKFNPR